MPRGGWQLTPGASNVSRAADRSSALPGIGRQGYEQTVIGGELVVAGLLADQGYQDLGINQRCGMEAERQPLAVGFDLLHLESLQADP